MLNYNYIAFTLHIEHVYYMYVQGKGKSMYIQRRIHMRGIFKLFLFRFLKKTVTSNSALISVNWRKVKCFKILA